VCVPWVFATLGVFQEGIDGGWGLEYSRSAAGWFLEKFVHTAGATLILASGFGYLHLGAVALRDRKLLDPYWAVMVALPLGVYIIYTLVPIGGIESRYLIPAIPPFIVLGIRGLAKFGSWFRHVAPAGRRTISIAVGCLVITFDLAFNFSIPDAGFQGFRPLVNEILANTSNETEFLVSSDPKGEGALIAEVLLEDSDRPRHTVHRGSKVLANSDWLGRGYTLIYDSTESLGRFLENSRIEWVVVDRSVPEGAQVPHQALLDSTLSEGGFGYTRFREIPVKRNGNHSDGTAVIFRRTVTAVNQD
jgi:hypothetical protein